MGAARTGRSAGRFRISDTDASVYDTHQDRGGGDRAGAADPHMV
ncbi:hypothetical protein [uncultured Williamsia sp.]|nr:hypothetical protein [uncultured Williamsia sp.]